MAPGSWIVTPTSTLPLHLSTSLSIRIYERKTNYVRTFKAHHVPQEHGRHTANYLEQFVVKQVSIRHDHSVVELVVGAQPLGRPVVRRQFHQRAAPQVKSQSVVRVRGLHRDAPAGRLRCVRLGLSLTTSCRGLACARNRSSEPAAATNRPSTSSRRTGARHSVLGGWCVRQVYRAADVSGDGLRPTNEWQRGLRQSVTVAVTIRCGFQNGRSVNSKIKNIIIALSRSRMEGDK